MRTIDRAMMALALTTAAPALANGFSLTLPTAGLDLSRPADRAEYDRRLDRAIRLACLDDSRVRLSERGPARACVMATRADAAARLNGSTALAAGGAQ